MPSLIGVGWVKSIILSIKPFLTFSWHNSRSTIHPSSINSCQNIFVCDWVLNMGLYTIPKLLLVDEVTQDKVGTSTDVKMMCSSDFLNNRSIWPSLFKVLTRPGSLDHILSNKYWPSLVAGSVNQAEMVMILVTLATSMPFRIASMLSVNFVIFSSICLGNPNTEMTTS